MLTPETLQFELPAGYRWEQGASGLMAVWRDSESALQAAGFGPDTDGALSKSDAVGRVALREIRGGEETYLVRRFSHGGLLRWLSGTRFRDPRRPFEELRLSHGLNLAGGRTPRVVAARAQRIGAWWGLDVVTARVEGATDIGRWIAEIRKGIRSREGLPRLMSALGQLVLRLHEGGFLHADLQPNNILVEEPTSGAEEPQLWVLDLDRSVHEEALDLELRMKNLGRLTRFVERRERERGACLTRTDRMRFLRGYEPERPARHELWRGLAAGLESSGRHGVGWMLERAFGGRDPREG